MKLNKLITKNYKSLRNVDLCFNGQNTVIFGVNGTGKSTLLSAINFLARPWIYKIIKTQSNENQTFIDSDVSIDSDFLELIGEFSLNETTFTLKRSYKKTQENKRISQKTYDQKKCDDFVNAFQSLYLNGDSNAMPIYTFYGTNRSVINIPEKYNESKTDMISALDRAIDSSVDFKNFFEWYRDCETKETIAMREAMDNNAPIIPNPALNNVRYAIEAMIENVSDLRIKHDPIRMTVIKDNKEIRVDMLSDGEKCTLALFGDLARRLCLANPHSPEPLKGKGIVLIDEIELHMHPSWQRKVLEKLTSVFPNIQFIITTHSPQVLGEANNDFLILTIDENTKAIEKVDRLDGYDSNFILEKYMKTSSKSQKTKNLISTLNYHIAKKEYAEASKLLSEFKALVGENNADYILVKGYYERSKKLDAENR